MKYPHDWPSVIIPLPVKFALDPVGGLYMNIQELPREVRPEQYIQTARDLFLPSVPALNGAGLNLRGRRPEAYTLLPELDEVKDEVARWLM